MRELITTSAVRTLAHLLGLSHPRDLALQLAHLERLSGKENIAARVVHDIARERIRVCHTLKLRRPTPRATYQALIAHTILTEQQLTRFLRTKDADCAYEPHAMERLFALAVEGTTSKRGTFLKVNCATKILRELPPSGIMRHLKYRTVDQLLAAEDLIEIFCALRFSESKAWSHALMVRYEKLRPDDFEIRPIVTRVLASEKWFELAKRFVTKKYHNLSHSKEMGVIFALPYPGHFCGMNMRALALVFHYFAEVHFYGELFSRLRKSPGNHFGRNFVVAIEGDVRHHTTIATVRRSFCWPLLQRYLAKDRTQDWRFTFPHVMPEALHWSRALRDLVNFGRHHKVAGLRLWAGDLDWVGFDGGITTVTLNLEDLIFSSAMRLPWGRHYTYHWREALWNKIFASAVGEKRMTELMQKNLTQGKICEI